MEDDDFRESAVQESMPETAEELRDKIDEIASMLERQVEWPMSEMSDDKQGRMLVGVAQRALSNLAQYADSLGEMSEELAEEPNEGNKFTGEREKAIAAGEDEFEVDGKKYKVKEGSDLSVMANSMDKVERTYAEIVKAQPEQSEVGDYIGRGMTGDQIKKLIDMLEPQGYDKDYLMKDLAPMMEGGVEEEIVSEAPTMDTTQLVTLLKNAGLSEEAIKQKLDEWANTPEGVGEVEPTDHGEAYEMAQAVNLSLKKYLDAEDMKVTVKEHRSEDLTALYEEYKNTKK